MSTKSKPTPKDFISIFISILALTVAVLTWLSTSEATRTAERAAELNLLSGRVQSCTSLYDHAFKFNQKNNMVNRANAMHALAQCYASSDIVKCVDDFNKKFRGDALDGSGEMIVC